MKNNFNENFSKDVMNNGSSPLDAGGLISGGGLSIGNSNYLNISFQDYLNKIKFHLKSRWRATFKIKDILIYTLKQICCCKINGYYMKSVDYDEKKQRILYYGEKKILKDLDCINMMTKLREVSFLMNLFLNEH